MSKVKPANFNADDLRSTQWVGIVENTIDDIFEGRCKIRVYGKMDERVDSEDPESAYKIPTPALPWARPHQLMYGGSSTGSGKFEIPKLGSIVRMTFDNGNFYQPIYHENIYPSDETKAEIEASYQNSHVLIYDTAFGLTGGENGAEVTNDREGEHVKVFFTEEKGLMMDYTTSTGPTTINIKPDNSVEIINTNGDTIVMLNDGNITFTHSAQVTINCEDAIINCNNTIINHSSSIELGEGASEKVVLGNKFMALFNSHTHIGDRGGLTSSPITKMTPGELSQKNVKTL
jgi:hypothetical protein